MEETVSSPNYDEKCKQEINDATEGQKSTNQKDVKHRPPPVDVSSSLGAPPPLGQTPPISEPRTPSSKYDTIKDKEKKIGHRRVDHGGQVTYKKIGTNQIMSSIQLGIQQAVGSLASKPEVDVLIQDFYVVETISFPNTGTKFTPAHSYSEYKFKVYAPIAFRHFRDLFKIAPDDFLLSVCNEPLTELSNPGASGSIFYLTNDDEFIIKTVQHKEAEFLQKLLPGYYMNLNQNPRTLLPKFFGLYTYQCNTKNIRMTVMNNLLPSSIKMHQKYDLKGSTYKRKANKYERQKKSPTFKDLDFMDHHPDGILLEAETCKALINTMERDCRVLTSFKIMDYSLLVGIHNLDLAAKERLERITNKTNGRSESSPSEDAPDLPSALNRSRSINRQRLVAHSTAMESIQAESDPIDEEEHVPPGGIPARNTKGERLLLFLGIIDILQSFRLKKRLEHTMKSMIHDGDTISVHRPTFYSQRFQKFMSEKVFKRIPSPLRQSPSRRRGASMRVGNMLRPISQSDAEFASSSDNQDNGHPSLRFTGSGRGSTYSGNFEPRPPIGATPPPTWEAAMNSDGSTAIELGDVRRSSSTKVQIRSLASHVTTVAIQDDRTDVVSVSDVHLEPRVGGGVGIGVSSSLGVEDFGGGVLAHHHHTRHHTWTPPLSVEGSTPTWTEGTPSFTESSSSGDIGCLTTPVRSLNTTQESNENISEGEMTHL